MPSSETFDIEPIHNFVWKYLSESKVSIDPFARNKRWATHTNDLNPDTQAEHHLEALEFLELLHSRGVKADFAVFDPPYSITQCAQVYQGVGRPFLGEDSQQQGGWYKHREILNQLLSNEATVLTFGWNSIGMGKKYGFGLEEILLVCHGRAHNDTICIAEKRLQGGLWK
jgi:hypothetical protein